MKINDQLSSQHLVLYVVNKIGDWFIDFSFELKFIQIKLNAANI